MTEKEEYIVDIVVGYFILALAGVLGFHRFYFGKWFSGFLYMLTGGFCMIGVVIDIMLVPKWALEKHERKYVIR